MSFTCTKCNAVGGQPHPTSGETTEPMSPPVPNKYWNEVQEKICNYCWADWKDMEVKIINEYRLNMLEREHRKLLKKYMNDHLGLGDGSAPVPNEVAANWTPEAK